MSTLNGKFTTFFVRYNTLPGAGLGYYVLRAAYVLRLLFIFKNNNVLLFDDVGTLLQWLNCDISSKQTTV